MKLEITTSAKNVEMANFAISRFIEAAKNNPEYLSYWGVTEKDLEKAELFRKSLTKSFLKKH